MDYKLVPTEHDFYFQNFEYMVYKLKENSDGTLKKITYMFNNFKDAENQFLKLSNDERQVLKANPHYNGFERENLDIITAQKTDLIRDSFGVYNYNTHKVITQILLLTNKK